MVYPGAVHELDIHAGLGLQGKARFLVGSISLGWKQRLDAGSGIRSGTVEEVEGLPIYEGWANLYSGQVRGLGTIRSVAAAPTGYARIPGQYSSAGPLATFFRAAS